MAFGMFTNFAYLAFLLWALLTAPAGPHHPPAFGTPNNLSSTMIYGYSIFLLIVQNMLKNPNKKDYQKTISYVYLIAILTYAFMLTVGGFGT